MYNEKKRAIILPEWQHLKSHALEWTAGQTLTHEQLCKLMYLPSKSQKYYNIMRRAVKELTEIGVLLANVKNVGYRVLTPDEWLDEAKRRMQKGSNNVQEVQRIINNAPYLQMTEEVKTECLQLHEMLVKQKYLLSGGVIQISSTAKKTMRIREGNKI